MALFNYLLVNITCPRCGVDTEMEAEFRFGLRNLIHYHIGDQLRWDGNGVKTPEVRPDEGNYADEAYVVCPHCERDFWLTVSVRKDIIVSAIVDTAKQPYIPDEAGQQPEELKSPAAQNEWNPIAFAEKMRRSTSNVSAFFIIDSVESFQKCIQWLFLLKPYNMPDMGDSPYFKELSEIYVSGKEIMNFDYEFQWLWHQEEYPGRLRYHYFDPGRSEVELWLPGVLAHEIADTFGDGHEGFFCAFMPPAFYD